MHTLNRASLLALTVVEQDADSLPEGSPEAAPDDPLGVAVDLLAALSAQDRRRVVAGARLLLLARAGGLEQRGEAGRVASLCVDGARVALGRR